MAASIFAAVDSSTVTSGERVTFSILPSRESAYLAPETPGSMKIALCSGINRSCNSSAFSLSPLSAEFQAATLDNDKEKALELQDRLMPLHKAIFIEPGLAGVKYALSRLGKMENVVRLPLTTVEGPTAEKIDAAMKHAGLIN